jgi:SpoVK/Ycf46/Vps4 family AAA+-type ATPase
MQVQNQPSKQILVTLEDYLNYSFQLYQEAYNLQQQFIYEKAVEKYDEIQKYLNHVYPYVNEQATKIRIEEFLKTVNIEKGKAIFQIENRFKFKKEAGPANSKEEDKVELTNYIKNSMNYNPEPEKIYKVSYINKNENKSTSLSNQNTNQPQNNTNNNPKTTSNVKEDRIVPDDLKNKILGEILDTNPGVPFCDVIGLNNVKQILKEIIILPTIRPDLFTGLRSPPKGLLLFGPPGTGKTMIAKAVATECKCTFFSISASALTSKYVGESEKLVRALFDIANEKQPSVVFIDEIESILSKRSEGENDATKRLKTEFLIQFDGVGSQQDAKVLIIGATNRPFDLDTAVLRRMPKRVLIPAFNEDERFVYLKHIFKNNEHNIIDDEFKQIAKLTENYSNSDLKELSREAAYEPIRDITDMKVLENLGKLRGLVFDDLFKATKIVRGTLNDKILNELNVWNKEYGALA